MVAYHLHLSSQRESSLTPPAAAAPEQIESLLERIEELLGNLELATRISASRIMLRVRKIASRSRLEREDVNMLHGLFKKLERKIKGDPGGE
jgi:tRNA C32,U32 (ribose-2'-O)-methylase TrmJ